jgi:phage I-like protein
MTRAEFTKRAREEADELYILSTDGPLKEIVRDAHVIGARWGFDQGVAAAQEQEADDAKKVVKILSAEMRETEVDVIHVVLAAMTKGKSDGAAAVISILERDDLRGVLNDTGWMWADRIRSELRKLAEREGEKT